MQRSLKFPLLCIKFSDPRNYQVTSCFWTREFKYRRIRVSKLVGTQPSVLIKGLAALDWRRPIYVVRIAGVYYIRDGHHRVYRAIQRGQKTIAAQVLILS